MDKREYMLLALQSGAYKLKHWVISVLSIIYEEPDAWQADPFDFRLVRNDLGVCFVKNKALVVITDADVTKELVRPELAVKLKAGDLPNITEDIDSTYGNLIFNAMILVYAFGGKIPYNNGKISARKLESQIEAILVDDVPLGELESMDAIYVHEYKRFAEAMLQLTGYNYLMVPSASPKTLTRDPRIVELRKRLIAENKDRLHDPAVVARIDEELIKMDREWVDDDGKDFYIKAKSFENVRKKVFLLHGIEKSFAEGEDPVFIDTSLSEGWDYENLPAMANSLREGSYNRGSETQLGGVKAKEAFRNFQNVTIAEVDCGSVLGMPETVTKDNAADLVGFFYVSKGLANEITSENVQGLMGSKIIRRSPMLCKTTHNDYCQTCMGRKISENPNALGAIVAAVGSTFLQAFMKKMHVTNLKVAKYDYRSTLS